MSNILREELMSSEKTVTVLVNGTPKQVTKGEVTFEDVVELAFPNPWSNPNIMYTVAYRRGHGDKPQSTMVQGGDPVKVKNEMIFDVTPTDKS
jgi:ABC-type sulfate transport system substrate-binding protein